MAIRMCQRCEGAVKTADQAPNPDGDGVVHNDLTECDRIRTAPSQLGKLPGIQAHHDNLRKYGHAALIPEDEL
jgi:hypothetical protein